MLYQRPQFTLPTTNKPMTKSEYDKAVGNPPKPTPKPSKKK